METTEHSQRRLFIIFIIALALSLMIHGVLLLWTRHFAIQNFGEAYYEQLVPKSFHLNRVDIDPKLLTEPPEALVQDEIKPTALAIPHESFTFESESPSSASAPMPEQISAESLSNSTLTSTAFEQALVDAQRHEPKELISEIEEIREQLSETAISSATRPILPLSSLDKSFTLGIEASTGQLSADFSDLDQLLAATGPLTKDTKPILVSSDVLFDYNASELRTVAVKSLQKLGTLLQRNPEANFIIEGHTDSFGSDEYNQSLSERRADSVKHWLVTNANINPSRIETHGYGKTRLLVPGTGSIAKQQINRRVEIRIK